VAASATFQRSHYVQLKPGQSDVVAGYTMKVVRPTAAIVPTRRHWRLLTLGAIVRVSRAGH